ncbi:cytochrome-c peroxidase [Mucilaginibacter sp. FT3.2]|uniref:cytochrome-c peroxidase n=1 Tax=Mucilaginibacter sp. FT3.2 TaxID=2723090 RepID=UPI0017ED53EA|nr:cytochrome c peroxidase [Mucilaginibacter sp. FT3.2]MBB6231954.1 cytochrome c peroxidase [Mucilaginibacter sp. FT3.2]
MKAKPHILNFFRCTFTGKAGVSLFLLLAVVALSAFTYYQDTVPTGAFQLVYPANFGNRVNTPADNVTTKQGVYLGRLLFYETRLSANNTLSCSSCHQQQKAFTDGRALSPGVDKVLSTRNSMSLVNLLWARKFFWDGRAASLEEQAAMPLSNPHEMGQSLNVSAQKLNGIKSYTQLFRLVYGDTLVTGDRIVKAIAQFERTLISANSPYDRYLKGTYRPIPQELKGMALFNQAPQPEKGIRGANCAHCHGGAKNYMELFHNNGLDSIPKDAGIETITGLVQDRGRFKVPTLRNIALTGPYMHDGRFKTLDEVVDHYSNHIRQSASLSSFLQGESNEPGGRSLKLLPAEKKELIAFLNMLTDSTFINNPQFADPRLSALNK